MTIEELKLHLRVDHTDEDELIQSFLTAATSYINQQTGKTAVRTGEIDPVTLLPVTKDISTDELYNLAIKIMVTHWYDNRGLEVPGKTAVKISHSFDAIVNHIAMCGDYV